PGINDPCEGRCPTLPNRRAAQDILLASRAAAMVHRAGQVALQQPRMETVAERNRRREESAASGCALTTSSITLHILMLFCRKGTMPVQVWTLSTAAIIALATTTFAQQPKVSDKDYIAKAITAAPEAITKGAAIVAMENDGTMRTLQR